MMKSDMIWQRLMVLGYLSGCHQMPERSFFCKGYQLPVCARCTGVIIGYIISLITFKIISPNLFVIVLCCLIMFIDWFIQFIKIKLSNNIRRFVTGIVGGYGVFSCYIFLIKLIISLFNN